MAGNKQHLPQRKMLMSKIDTIHIGVLLVFRPFLTKGFKRVAASFVIRKLDGDESEAAIFGILFTMATEEYNKNVEVIRQKDYGRVKDIDHSWKLTLF